MDAPPERTQAPTVCRRSPHHSGIPRVFSVVTFVWRVRKPVTRHPPVKLVKMGTDERP